VLLTSTDPLEVRRAASAYGVTHLAVDRPLREEYGDEALARLGPPLYKPLFESSAVLILELAAPSDAAP
jgi:hypothetical protein